MTDLLTMMATPAWAYLAVFGFLAVDALVPVVPTQAIMITAGALTVYGGLSLPLVIAVGALGMFSGDLMCFLLGRTAGRTMSGRLAALRKRCAGDPKEHRARRAAERFTRGLRKPGPLVLLLCRFVPGGRMAAGYQAGRKSYPPRLFVTFDGAAALAWATYGGLVGHIGGTALTNSAWKLFAVAAVAAVIFGTSGWVLALFGGRHDEPSAEAIAHAHQAGQADALTAARAASVDGPPRRSSRTTTGRS
jgi:membrane-associated protein